MKILVVDDQAGNRRARASAMKLVGYQVDEAVSGLDALKRFIADHYDVILIDYDIPFINGLDCTRKIREYENGTASKAIIIGVAHGKDKNLQEKCLDAGMDAFVDKSSSLEDLQMMIRELAVA